MLDANTDLIDLFLIAITDDQNPSEEPGQALLCCLWVTPARQEHGIADAWYQIVECAKVHRD